MLIDFEKTKYISFLIKYYELLKKYNKIWEKIKDKKKMIYKKNVIVDQYTMRNM